MSYPALHLCGVAVTKIGNSSVDYAAAIFAPTDPAKSVLTDAVWGHFATGTGYKSESGSGSRSDSENGSGSGSNSEICSGTGSDSVIDAFEPAPLAIGRSTHVFVDKANGNRPTRIPDDMREGMQRILCKDLRE